MRRGKGAAVLTPVFRELKVTPSLRQQEVLLVGSWDIPVARLACHLRQARINGTAPEPPSVAPIWVDSAGQVCGMTVGVN